MSEQKRFPRPVGYTILVRLKNPEVEKVSKGGIIYEAHYGEQHKRQQFASEEAYVIALSDLAYHGRGNGDPWCKVGDLVKIAKYSGQDQQDIIDGEIFRVIADTDVQCIMEGESL